MTDNHNNSCWVCNGPVTSEQVTLRGGIDTAISVCTACDFHFFNKDNSRLLQKDQLDQTRLQRAGLDIPEVQRDFENGLLQSRAYIDEFISENDRGRNVLEIGCSWGYFLHLAAKAGARPYGVEINPVRTRYVVDKLNIPCYENLAKLEEQNLKFRKIFMFYVLEYIAEPRNYLSRLCNLLEDGGKLIFITPNLRDVLKDIWHNEGYRAFFYDECAISYYSTVAVRRLMEKLESRPGSVEVSTRQGYSFLNHASWHFTQKPGTTGIVGGDHYIENVSESLAAGNSSLGEALSHLLVEFDTAYRETIEAADFGNQIQVKLVR
ncbi:MAG: class I SAM-dependent methyltransferase [Calditrichaeota bacterium]|nr:class I SAM-dependent methyltransferase [Calditrichota bacterium]